MNAVVQYLLSHIHRTQHKGMAPEGCEICAILMEKAA